MKEYKYNEGFEPMKNNICNHSCGIMPAPMEAQQAVNILIDYLLGDDWYVVSPMNQKQVNACAVEQILDKYSKQWRRDWKYYEKKLLGLINNKFKIEEQFFTEPNVYFYNLRSKQLVSTPDKDCVEIYDDGFIPEPGGV